MHIQWTVVMQGGNQLVSGWATMQRTDGNRNKELGLA